MDSPAEFSVRQAGGAVTAVLTGDWTAVGLGDAGQRLSHALDVEHAAALDLNAIGRCDTAGAFAILRASEGRVPHEAITAPRNTTRLHRVAFGLPTHHPIFGSDPHMSFIQDTGGCHGALI